MKSIVKINWNREKPVLKLATENGYEYLELEKGRELDFEIVNSRRCVGFHERKGSMTSCPDFRKIDSGDQCSECRNKDIYTGWRQGNSSPDYEADYSVYLVQAGKQLKVGVTRSNRIENRWKEQGADYAVELEKGLSAEEALNREATISARNGIKERITKKRKLEPAPKELIKNKLLEITDGEGTIQEISENPECNKVKRKGRIPQPIEGVKGQIIYNSRYGLAMGSGKVLKKPEQKGLTEF